MAGNIRIIFELEKLISIFNLDKLLFIMKKKKRSKVKEKKVEEEIKDKGKKDLKGGEKGREKGGEKKELNKVYVCPKCKSVKVKRIFGLRNLFGLNPRWRCDNCGFEEKIFPLLYSKKVRSCKKVKKFKKGKVGKKAKKKK